MARKRSKSSQRKGARRRPSSPKGKTRSTTKRRAVPKSGARGKATAKRKAKAPSRKASGAGPRARRRADEGDDTQGFAALRAPGFTPTRLGTRLPFTITATRRF